MMKRILFVAAGLLALGVLSSCEEVLPEEQVQCEAGGGTWGPFGLLATPICYPAYEDAGKACTKSTECQGLCAVEYVNEAPTDAGTCAATILFGCMEYLDDAGEYQAICVD